jgi:hypothetical protein
MKLDIFSTTVDAILTEKFLTFDRRAPTSAGEEKFYEYAKVFERKSRSPSQKLHRHRDVP